MARNQDQLKKDCETVKKARADATVKTYAVDVTDSAALRRVLADIKDDLGPPEAVFFNAARVRPSTLLEVEDEELLYDYKVSCLCTCHVLDLSKGKHPRVYTFVVERKSHLLEGKRRKEQKREEYQREKQEERYTCQHYTDLNRSPSPNRQMGYPPAHRPCQRRPLSQTVSASHVKSSSLGPRTKLLRLVDSQGRAAKSDRVAGQGLSL